MLQLPNKHPASHAQLMNGEFAVQRTHGTTFGCIPQDQTIEVTLNRDTKTAGGIIGMSLNPAAVNKWILTAMSRVVRS